MTGFSLSTLMGGGRFPFGDASPNWTILRRQFGSPVIVNFYRERGVEMEVRLDQDGDLIIIPPHNWHDVCVEGDWATVSCEHIPEYADNISEIISMNPQSQKTCLRLFGKIF